MLVALIQILSVVIIVCPVNVVLVVVIIRFVIAPSTTLLELLIAIELLLVAEITRLSVASPVYLEFPRARSAYGLLSIAHQLTIAPSDLDVVNALPQEFSEIDKSVHSFLI
jgi:hypothetical protein